MTTYVYDLEIRRAIPDPDQPRQPGIEYCEGWHDHANMGISVLCAATAETSDLAVYLDDNLYQFPQLVNAHGSLLVGFNNIRFDDQVIGAQYPGWLSQLGDIPRYDILREIWISEGLPPAYIGEAQKGYSLEDMAMANLSKGKSGNGAAAPIDWQCGKYGRVINYCAQDVKLTLALYKLIMTQGYLVRPTKKGGGYIDLPPGPTTKTQWEWDNLPH